MCCNFVSHYFIGYSSKQNAVIEYEFVDWVWSCKAVSWYTQTLKWFLEFKHRNLGLKGKKSLLIIVI